MCICVFVFVCARDPEGVLTKLLQTHLLWLRPSEVDGNPKPSTFLKSTFYIVDIYVDHKYQPNLHQNFQNFLSQKDNKIFRHLLQAIAATSKVLIFLILS